MIMEEMIRIYCRNTKTYGEFRPGVSLMEVYRAMGVELTGGPLAARVNNKTEDLGFRCYRPKDVEFLAIGHPSAMRVYVRSLCFVLSKAVDDLYGAKVFMEHPVSRGYYCELGLGRAPETADVEAIRHRMQAIVDADIPFRVVQGQTEAIVRLFRERGMEDKAALLETCGSLYASYQELGGYVDGYYGALLPSTASIRLFGLEPLERGVLLRVPSPEHPGELQPMVRQEKMMAVFREQRRFLRVLELKNVGDLNVACREGQASSIVRVAEALQEKIIARMAETIAERQREGVRVVLISGPSSSGKTTFCKRLQVQLMTNLLRPVGISLDDYYVNRVDTPRTAEGEYDFESFYAIDLATFRTDLARLLEGEEVQLPSYDFTLGRRLYRGNSVRLGARSVLVLEGIHALNPDLLEGWAEERVFRIYVSALTSISLDEHNWISTTDNRLIRRIVRDSRFRGYSARETIARWPSVRAGEERWIFPYQEQADAMFNSAMLYELAALRREAEVILTEVPPSVVEYAEAWRLRNLLGYFRYIDVADLPGTSLLREFVGGSSFS
jgi:uridine kinase